MVNSSTSPPMWNTTIIMSNLTTQAHLSNSQTSLELEVCMPSLSWTYILTHLCIVAAEYLAKGYKLSDHILQRAIEIDS
jgi:hypothetical protein